MRASRAVASVVRRCNVAVRTLRPCAAVVAPRAVPFTRAIATTPTLCQAGDDAEYREKVLDMAKQVNAEANTQCEEMVKLYGDDSPALSWMHYYLRSPSPQYVVPSLQLASNDERLHDSTEAAFIHFVAQVLRGLSVGDDGDNIIVDFAARAFMLDGARPDLVLAVLHQVGTPIANDCKQRMAKSLIQGPDGENGFAFQFYQTLETVPQRDILEWPVTFLQLDLAREMWKDPSGSVFAMTGFCSHALDELAGQVGTMGEEEAFQAWVTLTTKTVLESLWGHYWATGDAGYLRRIVSCAVPWLEFEQEVDIDAVLRPSGDSFPAHLKGPDDRATRVRLAAAAYFSLIINSRMQRGVVRALADEVTEGTDLFLEPHLRVNAAGADQEDKNKRAVFAASTLHLLARMQANSE